METTLTGKAQAGIPDHPLDASGVATVAAVEIGEIDPDQIELSPKGEPMTERERRFRSAIGSATIKWDVDELWKLLRGEDGWL